MENTSSLKHLVLEQVHLKLGARMVDFGGWFMPIQYSGIVEEHRTVRERAGLFDLSHMGEFDVRGPKAESFLEHVLSNSCTKLYDGRVIYSPLCNEEGRIIDDILVYRFTEERFMLVVNASNTANDLAWITKHSFEGVTIEDLTDQTVLIAVQGPLSEDIVSKVIPTALSEIRYYHFRNLIWKDLPLIISRTGYTGDNGFELYINVRGAQMLWESLSQAGQQFGMVPVGLGARDTLRLEAGLPLYGHELSVDTNPLEAGLDWAVGWNKSEWIGSNALIEATSKPLTKKLVYITMADNSIPRQGSKIFVNGEQSGVVTSGTFSPLYRKGICMGYINPKYAVGDQKVDIEIRGAVHGAVIQPRPWYKKTKVPGAGVIAYNR